MIAHRHATWGHRLYSRLYFEVTLAILVPGLEYALAPIRHDHVANISGSSPALSTRRGIEARREIR
jgi:hypothetical protein